MVPRLMTGPGLLGGAQLVACGGESTQPNPQPPSAIPVAAITIAPGNTTRIPQQTLQFTAAPRDAAGHPLPNRSVTWSPSAEGVATVTSVGLVTSVTPGDGAVDPTNLARYTATVPVLPEKNPIDTVTVAIDVLRSGETARYHSIGALKVEIRADLEGQEDQELHYSVYLKDRSGLRSNVLTLRLARPPGAN